MGYKILLFFILLLIFVFIRYKTSKLNLPSNSTIELKAILWSKPQKIYGEYRFSVEDFYVRVPISNFDHNIQIGNTIKVKGAVERKYNKYFVSASGVSLVKDTFIGAVRRYLYSVNQSACAVIRKNFPEPHASLLLGILLGVKSDLPPEFNDRLVNTGTIHVVVVSGYNISVLLTTLIPLFYIFGKRLGLPLVLLSLLIYVVLVGGDPPVIRAAIMGLIAMLGVSKGRQKESLYLLLLVAFIMIMFNPRYVTNISFMLSFAATLGLILFNSRISGVIPFDMFGLKEDLSATISAQIMVAPILMYYFGKISIISVFVNFLSLWVIEYATILGIAVLFLSPIPLLSPLINFIEFVLLNYFIFTINLFGSAFNNLLEVKLNGIFVIAYYIITFSVLFLWDSLKIWSNQRHLDTKK